MAVSVAGVAFAAAGDRVPELRTCIAERGAGGCETPVVGSLRGAASLAISPDGRSLYSAAYGADSVLSFRLAAGGRLSLQGCVANEGAAGCVDPPSDSLGGAGGITVSPGGGDVYVASGLGRSVTRFSRSSAGVLTFGSCTANDGRAGCSDPANDALVGAGAVAVGPGGEDIYVTSFDGGAVSHLRRAADGSLVLADCVADEGNFGCVDTPGSVIEGPTAIAVAPRGRDVYVTSLASGSLSQFRRAKDGRLSFRKCWADGGANGCEKLPEDVLLGATGMAVSPDGESIYVASQIGIVSRFDRSTRSGEVELSSCVGSDGKGGCVQPKRDSLALASGIATRGHDIYVAAQGGDSITRLEVDRRGHLRFVSCLAAGRANRCAGGVPAAALGGSYAVAVRSRALYVASPSPGAVSSLALPERGRGAP